VAPDVRGEVRDAFAANVLTLVRMWDGSKVQVRDALSSSPLPRFYAELA
jgi:hypothetical protein